MLLTHTAELIASAAHSAAGNKRKYLNTPYIEHPYEVVATLWLFGVNREEIIAAAWLHDVLEDTQLDPDIIHVHCGTEVLDYVKQLTDVKDDKLNRAQRKALDRQRLACAGYEVQTIKCTDMIDNTKSIVQYDPKFAVTYLKEKKLMLDVLDRADKRLRNEAYRVLQEAQASLDAQRLQDHLKEIGAH